jgi:hypothetical protein
MLCHGQSWPLNCAERNRLQIVPPSRPIRELYVGAARQINLRRPPGLARSGREILEPCFRVEVPLHVRHATDWNSVEWVQRHEAISLVKYLLFVQVRRDRPRAGEVRLPNFVDYRTAGVSCIALVVVNASNICVDQLRLMLCGTQSRQDVACVITI